VDQPPRSDVSGLLVAWRNGDRDALDQLMPLVYQELRRLAHARLRGERTVDVLQTTALVNETYLRLVATPDMSWVNRAHFFSVAAQIMRHVLVDAARARKAVKRGGGITLVPLDSVEVPAGTPGIDLLALDDALKDLDRQDPRKARVVELRYFAGLDVAETAAVLSVSADTVTRDWQMARLFLLRALRRTGSHGAEAPR
jgi:RNA polymerase sigma factor (TIGR02999 family)